MKIKTSLLCGRRLLFGVILKRRKGCFQQDPFSVCRALDEFGLDLALMRLETQRDAVFDVFYSPAKSGSPAAYFLSRHGLTFDGPGDSNQIGETTRASGV